MEETIINSIITKLEESDFPRIPSSDEFEEACKNAISKVEGIEGVDYKKGSSRFPDITFSIDDSKIGVEVKLITTNTWKAKGNSAVASTAVKGIDEIYILAGRFIKDASPEYKMKPMGKCISNVKVTHNPRYEIDMAYDKGDFCENAFRMKYDRLRIIPKEDREAVIGRFIAEDRYQKFDENKDNIKNKLLAEIFVLFPEVFSKHSRQNPHKFSRMSGWLFGHHIYPKNVRDLISSKGQWKYEGFNIPKIYETLNLIKNEFHKTIEEMPSAILEYAWKETIRTGKLLDNRTVIPDNKERRIDLWLELVCNMHKTYGFDTVENVKRLSETPDTKSPPEFKTTVKDILDI